MHKDMTLSEADRRPLLSVVDALDYAAELINFRRVNQMLMASVGSMVSDIPEAIRGAPQLVQEAMKVAQTQPEKQAEKQDKPEGESHAGGRAETNARRMWSPKFRAAIGFTSGIPVRKKCCDLHRGETEPGRSGRHFR